MRWKKYTKQDREKKGAVLIMAIVITSGILVLGSELVLFVLNSLQYGRSVDYSTVAQYAAESGAEHAMWQIRKEERATLDTTGNRAMGVLDENEKDYGWSFLNANGAIDPLKFSTSIDRIEKMFLPENASVQASLYTESNGSVIGIPNMKSLKVSWEKESCAPLDQRPWIETSIVQWTGGNSIDWSEAQVKKDFQQPLGADKKFVVVNFMSYEMDGKPMIVRVKTMFCDLSRFTITLHSDTSASDNALLSLPNYINANPSGSYRGFQQNSRVIFPQKGSLSNMFDFVLFSEDQLQK